MTVGSSSTSATLAPPSSAGPRVERQPGFVEQHPPGQRQAVGVHARRRQPDQRVARGAGAAVDDGVERDRAERRARPGRSRRATGGRGSPRAAGRPRRRGSRRRRPRAPARRPSASSASSSGSARLDGEVVEQRQRLGPDADQVVDVHGHAVDPDRVEAPRLLGDDHLGADAVGGQRDAEVGSDPDDAGVVPGKRHRQALAPRCRSSCSTSTSAATPRSACRVSTPAAA